MTAIAGVVFVTAPGAGPRVAERLAQEPGLTIAGNDGDSRVAAVWEGTDGAALEALSEGLLARDADVVGVFPTFVAREEAEP
jgi:hypothetical protein